MVLETLLQALVFKPPQCTSSTIQYPLDCLLTRAQKKKKKKKKKKNQKTVLYKLFSKSLGRFKGVKLFKSTTNKSVRSPEAVDVLRT